VPGNAFLPDDRRTLRVSVSNLGRTEILDLAGRLAESGGGAPGRL
jgi:hypothetical protein